ncbi:PREDICTED: proline-rich receptor-like protein kinase PERK10 [Chinchilla lanigera]|uniref:proline-rich receptor-like protein kinase PERK10 n=1 Tax=Chinchilla lanigera TaxID=34839 RepID=UPI0006976159|nr:PREDICTED: proline-rich receptor-like protein kinase PERK10 [Chinchilla lanigera]
MIRPLWGSLRAGALRRGSGAPDWPPGEGVLSPPPPRSNHSRPAWHLPREAGLRRAKFSRPEPLEALISADGAPRPPGPQSGEAPFPLNPSDTPPSASGRGRRSGIPRSDAPHPDSLDWITMKRTLQRSSSNQTPREVPPPTMRLGSTKPHSFRDGPGLGIAELGLNPGGPPVKQIPLHSNLGEVPPTDTIPTPPWPNPSPASPQPRTRWFKCPLATPAPSSVAPRPPPRAAHRRLPRISSFRQLPRPAPLKPASPNAAQPLRAFFPQPSRATQSLDPFFRVGEKRSEAAQRPSPLGARSQIGQHRHGS